MLICSSERPWGIHPAVRSDEDCPRCGWRAPGPLGDAIAWARADAEEALAQAAELCWWVVHDDRGSAEALAA
ncbi:MAG TPA: hypothetical protein VGB04_12875 [Allosphingosinicella sp.]|jgi:hypothetical protein